jgi:phosphoribosylformylglycinamidine (FGAM) synthase-like enzyme
MGVKEGWMDVDPRAAGIASFDSALRGLVAMGAEPSGGVGFLWIAQPEDSENVSETSAKWAAYVLALEGACAWAKSFDFKLHSINGGGVSFPGSRNEVFVDLRSRIQAASQVMVPGFRMDGELLYVVGPRPAFMDAGSKILDHVTRVISNHTSKLNPELQLKLYRELHRLAQQGIVTSLRSVGEGGVAEALGEMALWSGKGAQIRPNIPIIELFSGAPGRLVVGILPQEAKRFEALIPAEQLTPIGVVGGEKILGLPLTRLFEIRAKEVKG